MTWGSWKIHQNHSANIMTKFNHQNMIEMVIYRPLFLWNNPYVPFFNKIRCVTEIKYEIYGIYSKISSIIGFHWQCLIVRTNY
jgi:hypothetical protein